MEFMEKPKRLYFEIFQGREASCILPVQTGSNGLDRKRNTCRIVDSGVDYFHPDFRNEDGSSRILRLWDQSIREIRRKYTTGTEYTKEEIDEALALGENRGQAPCSIQISVDMELHPCWELQQEMGGHRME